MTAFNASETTGIDWFNNTGQLYFPSPLRKAKEIALEVAAKITELGTVNEVNFNDNFIARAEKIYQWLVTESKPEGTQP